MPILSVGSSDSFPIPLFDEIDQWTQISVLLCGCGDERNPHYSLEFSRKSGVSSSVSMTFSTVATNSSIILMLLASSCDEIVIVGGSTLCIISSCKHTLGFTRLTHISFSCGLSAFVLFSVRKAVVDLAISVFGVSVLGLFLSTLVVFGDELPPKMIFLGSLTVLFLVLAPLRRPLTRLRWMMLVTSGFSFFYFVRRSLVPPRVRETFLPVG